MKKSKPSLYKGDSVLTQQLPRPSQSLPGNYKPATAVPATLGISEKHIREEDTKFEKLTPSWSLLSKRQLDSVVGNNCE